MISVHPTALVSPQAKISDGVEIGPYAIVDDNVALGERTTIGAHAHITGWTELGTDNQVHMGAVLGHEPQDFSYKGQQTYLRIGNRNVFREYCWIHRGTTEGSATIIGDNNYFMGFSHAGHNCQIGNNVTVASNTLLAGYVVADDQVFISGSVVVHQFCKIGRLTMVSGLSAINKDVPPFMLVGGRPPSITGLNIVGLRRAGIAQDVRMKLRRALKLIYFSQLTTKKALAELEKSMTTDEEQELARFIRNSERGICRPRGQKSHPQSF